MGHGPKTPDPQQDSSPRRWQGKRRDGLQIASSELLNLRLHADKATQATEDIEAGRPMEKPCWSTVHGSETPDPQPTPRQVWPVYNAALRLMRLVLASDSFPDETEEESSLKVSLLPLVQNNDGHFITTLASLILSLLEGKTDCPIS